MKSIELILIEEDELPFYTDQSVEIIARNYGEFTQTDLELLEDLKKWLEGKEDNNEL